MRLFLNHAAHCAAIPQILSQFDSLHVFLSTAFAGLLAVCSEAKGLVGVKAHVNGISKAKIVPVQPGHIEEYDLKADGKVSSWFGYHLAIVTFSFAHSFIDPKTR